MTHTNTERLRRALWIVAIAWFILVVGTWTFAHAGDVMLTWTAPGDDGLEGQASEYDLRLHTLPITAGKFYDGMRVPTPAPSASGQRDSVVMVGLAPGIYYFAIKTADEVPNWSGISNVMTWVVSPIDTIPPFPITDLEVVDI